MNQVLSFFRRTDKEKTFEEVIAPYMDLLFKVAYQYQGNKVDAEDLVQDLLVDLYSKQSKVLKVEKLKPWLMRCLYNKFIDCHRKNNVMKDAKDCDCPSIEHEFAYQENFSGQRFHQQVLNGLNQLSAKQKAVITLHDIEGYTLLELEKIMGTAIGSLKSDLHRGRLKLKAQLQLQHTNIDLSYRQQGVSQ